MGAVPWVGFSSIILLVGKGKKLKVSSFKLLINQIFFQEKIRGAIKSARKANFGPRFD